jgi:L-asparaginase II
VGARKEPFTVAADGSFTVEIVRGGAVESAHLVHAVIADRHGTLEHWGDPTRPTIARSAIKSIQALPLVASGAADAHGVGPHELALACASHSAEPEHVEAVRSWLQRLGLSEDDLECGPDQPLGHQAREDFYRAERRRQPVLNCCSGKHTGFLTLACHLGYPTAGYIKRASPVQDQVTAAVQAMTGLDLSQAPSGIDGCGIPVFALPIERLAFAMARLVDPLDVPAELAVAAQRVVAAAQLAFWVSGSNRTEVVVTEAASEPVVIKTGAEGMFMAALPARGLGIALKVADGASRASQAAIKALLRHLEVLPPIDGPILTTNKAGDVSGETRPVIATPVRSRLTAAST